MEDLEGAEQNAELLLRQQEGFQNLQERTLKKYEQDYYSHDATSVVSEQKRKQMEWLSRRERSEESEEDSEAEAERERQELEEKLREDAKN